ncbi:MAG TPA: ABC transporter permease [Solirubrobacteraceae bacterium]|nr:ABC transporter permease [Solirubrobacteraceae bacterium]
MTSTDFPGRPLAGPTALGGDLRRFWRLTWTLAVTTFKLRFYGSALGYLWQLMRPLMLFGVLYVVFTEFVRLGDDIEHYPVVLLMGIVLFTFLSEATSAGVTSVVEREALIRKVEFPRMAIPCSVVLTALFNLGLNLIAVVVFAVIGDVGLHASLVQLPLIIAGLAAFVLGIVLLTSALYVRYRDVKPIWDVLLQMLFYFTPVLYPIEIVQERGAAAAEWLVTLNPFAAFVQQTRHAVIDPTAPSAAVAAGGWGRLAICFAITGAILAAGFLVFHRTAPYVAEEL